MIRTDLGWNTEALARSSLGDGIKRPKASIIAEVFAECADCGKSIKPRLPYSEEEDRDVVWDDRVSGSSNVDCPSCGANNRVLVEEKAFGIISADRLPDEAEEHENLIYIPVGCENWEDGVDVRERADTYLRINTYQVMVNSVSSEPENIEARSISG
jgi:DNA-directed RNA polymerase subunit RPC12/RpoP